jgi:hypothetical protein
VVEHAGGDAPDGPDGEAVDTHRLDVIDPVSRVLRRVRPPVLGGAGWEALLYLGVPRPELCGGGVGNGKG